MIRRRFSLRSISALATLMVAAALPVAAQQQQPGPKVAEDVYKNITVLKGTPEDRFDPTMRFFGAALGVRCQYCHVGGDFASDMKPQKATARKMVSMMQEINKANFNGRTVVTCYTCHAGHIEPIAVPVLPGTEVLPPPRPTLPDIDAVLTKYITAIGGDAAIRKVTSRVISGTQDVPDGLPGSRATVPGEFEQVQKAPNLVARNVHDQKHPALAPGSLGYDGNTAWLTNEGGMIEEMVPPNGDRFKRVANLFEPLNLKQDYMRMAVRDIVKINGKDAYMVVANPANDSAEQLFFDAQTGLLVRKLTVVTTPAGNLPAEWDYDDYRDTGSGVKIPFTIRIIPAVQGETIATPSTIKIVKVQDNVPVDAAKLARPAQPPKATPAQ